MIEHDELARLRESLSDAQAQYFDGSTASPDHLKPWNDLFVMLGRAEHAVADSDVGETRRWLSELETSYTELHKDFPRLLIGSMLEQLHPELQA